MFDQNTLSTALAIRLTKFQYFSCKSYKKDCANGKPIYKDTYNVNTEIRHLHTMGAISIDLQFEKSFKKTDCQLGSVFILNKWKR